MIIDKNNCTGNLEEIKFENKHYTVDMSRNTHVKFDYECEKCGKKTDCLEQSITVINIRNSETHEEIPTESDLAKNILKQLTEKTFDNKSICSDCCSTVLSIEIY